MVKKINILFVCRHNLFRSQIANAFFKKLNKNKKYQSESAGIIKWSKKDLVNDKDYEIEKKISRRHGININKPSKCVTSSLLKKTDILIIVADDVSNKIFNNEKSFNGKLIVWKASDIKINDKQKEKVAL